MKIGRPSSEELDFDQILGVETSGRVLVQDVVASKAVSLSARNYVPTSPKRFRNIILELGIEFEPFVFIDIGSGKGRTLFMAMEFPFKKLIGIEFAPNLHQICVENVSRLAATGKNTERFELNCQDAGEYRFASVPTVIYMYNPFGPMIMERVLKNMQASLSGTELILVYVEPKQEHQIAKCGLFTKTHAGENYVVYRHLK